MARTQKFSEKEYREALEANDWNKAEVARQLGVNVSTVSRNIKRYDLERYENAVVDDAIGNGEGKPLYTKKLYVKAIKDSHGIKSTIAKRAGVSFNTLKDALIRWPDLKELIIEESERLFDNAESVLVNLLSKNDFRAAKFILETKGKSRGYGKAMELSGPGGEALFSPAVMALMKEKNIEQSVLIAEFERIMLSSVEEPHP